MGATTSRLQIPYPVASDTPNIPGHMQSLADRLDTIVPPYSEVSSLPAAGNAGFFYFLTTTKVLYFDDGTVLQPLNAPVTTTVTLPHTWAISGPFDATSGSDTYFPPLAVPVPSGQTVTLVKIFASVRSGGCTVSMSAGGSPISGLTAMGVTTTQQAFTNTGGAVTFTDGEDLAPTVTAISGNPDGLSITAVLAYSSTNQD